MRATAATSRGRASARASLLLLLLALGAASMPGVSATRKYRGDTSRGIARRARPAHKKQHQRAAPPLTRIDADSPLVKWVGRAVPDGSGAVFFDWEGVTASLIVSNATVVLAEISDACAGVTNIGGGSRWSVEISPPDAR
jgi:hypothetical protein